MDFNALTYKDGHLFWLNTNSYNNYVNKKAGWVNSSGYRMITYKLKPTLAHRIVWIIFNGEIPEDMVIDHINGKRDDNRIENLQCVSRKQNNQRKYATKTKGYTVKNRPFPYQAQKTYNKKRYNLGYFGTPCGATMAHNTFFINKKGI